MTVQILKWVAFGLAFAAVKSLGWCPYTQIAEKSACAARKGAVALAGVLTASLVLGAGIVLTVTKFFDTFENPGSFTLTSSMLSGYALVVTGSLCLYFMWPKKHPKSIDQSGLS